jgi:curved DNA-binding protein CbpA
MAHTGNVDNMPAGDDGRSGPDLYELLGVARCAQREEIVRAWRRQALTVHPDIRGDQDLDDEATGRFRALAEAYHVLSDPLRRAAYDRTLASDREAAAKSYAIPVRVRLVPSSQISEPGPMPGPPLRAGPVRVEYPSGYPVGGEDEDELRIALLAARWLARGRRFPW